MIEQLAEEICKRIAPRILCEHLTPADVAKILNVSDKHITNLIETGKLEAIDVSDGGKKRWRVSVEHLERFRAARSNRVA